MAKQLFILSVVVPTFLLILRIALRRSIILLSLPFLASYNACAALFRTMGNSKGSLLGSTLMNITTIGASLTLSLFSS